MKQTTQKITPYFVLYHRDLKTEKSDSRAKGREVYDILRGFKTLDTAKKFSLENLHELPLFVKRYPIQEEESEPMKESEKPYIVSAYFKNKYYHGCYDGSSDPVPTHEVIRCAKHDLESAITEFAREAASRIDVGIELKILV